MIRKKRKEPTMAEKVSRPTRVLNQSELRRSDPEIVLAIESAERNRRDALRPPALPDLEAAPAATYDPAIALYASTIPVFVRMLHAMERWLDKAEDFAEARKTDANELMQARFAQSPCPLIREIAAACDTAKWAAAKLSGQPAPADADTEETVSEIRARIASAIRYLESFEANDFAGAVDRPCKHAWMEEKCVLGENYVREFALPNFYFHAATAYQLLQQNGVPLEKRDYLSSLTLV